MHHHEGLMFVGTGVKHSVAHFMNANQLRGSVFVYKVVADGNKPNLLPLTVLPVSTGGVSTLLSVVEETSVILGPNNPKVEKIIL